MAQKQAHTTQNKEAGFMGLDGMGAVLFYIIMIAGATLLIVQLFANTKISRTAQALSSMRIGIQGLYIMQPNYGTKADDITAIVATAGIPLEGFTYDKHDNVIKSLWDTDITVVVDTNDAAKFYIKIEGVPAKSFVRLVTYDFKTWDRVQVAGLTVESVQEVYDTYEDLASKDGVVSLRFYSN